MAQRLATRDDVCGPVGTPGGVAPALNGLTDDQIAPWLDIAAELIGLKRWGTRASHGHALATAHFLEANLGDDGLGPGAEAGPLSAEAVGPASRSFSSGGSFSDPDFSTTSYGRAFVLLRRVVRGRGSAVAVRRLRRW